MNITITGNLGSGKTSVCKELKKFGFQVISAGDIFREIAAEKGMTVIELNEAAKSDRSIDDMLDNRSTELGKKLDHTVFDSRLAWHFVENSFKVFLLVDMQEAARRVFAGDSRGAEEYKDMQAARAGLEERAALEKDRFFHLYGVNYYDAKNYDLIIESSSAEPWQIAREIKRNFELYQAQPFRTKVELNVRCLYPGKQFAQIKQDVFEAYKCGELGCADTLCAADPVEILVQNGYNYLRKGHHRIFAAAAAGKVFAEVTDIRAGGGTQESVAALSRTELAEFEKAGGFSYRFVPCEQKEKAGYTVDFSRVFK